MDMSNMDHSSDTTTTTTTSSGNHMMNMAFHSSITDNLFSEAWTPKTTGQYAGACIFLIVLAIIHRALTAYKSIQDAKWHKQEKARVVVVAGGNSGRSSSENDPKAAGAVADAQSVKSEKEEENPWTTPWRFTVEVPRAALSTLVSGVGYLLMLAVMTCNVGYFMSIIAGIFVGELAFGRIHKHGGH